MNSIALCAYSMPAIALFCMIMLYAIGVQYERGGLWKLVAPFTLTALAMSWLLNQTLGRVVYGKPASWRETFSKHTEREQFSPGFAGRFARLVAAVLNFFAHDEGHVKP